MSVHKMCSSNICALFTYLFEWLNQLVGATSPNVWLVNLWGITDHIWWNMYSDVKHKIIHMGLCTKLIYHLRHIVPHLQCHHKDIWVRSRNCGCLVTWFCYQLIAKPGNRTAAVSWPDPYVVWCLLTPCYIIQCAVGSYRMLPCRLTRHFSFSYTYQIWMWIRWSKLYFCDNIIVPNEEIDTMVLVLYCKHFAMMMNALIIINWI